MEKRYKEVDGVRYQVIQNTILGSNVVPVGESLPEVTTSDNGKLLGVSSGEWTPVDAPSGLPDITGNAGKVLKVNAGATGTEWANETTELPAVTSADEGDVLTVNASGEWEAAAPGGGGDDFNFVTVTNNNNTLSSDISAEKVFQDLQAGKRYGVKYKNAPSENPVFIGELLVSTVSTNTQVRASVINLDGGVGNTGPGSIAIRAIWIRYYNSAYSWSKSYGVAQIATTVPGT